MQVQLASNEVQLASVGEKETLISGQNDEELLIRAETAKFLKVELTILLIWTRTGKFLNCIISMTNKIL